MDLDITQDFVGIFNKLEMCEYLVQNHNFRYQGDLSREECNTIVNNDKSVGIDCLTWLTPCNARVKLYNKFVCQITSPGVNKPIYLLYYYYYEFVRSSQPPLTSGLRLPEGNRYTRQTMLASTHTRLHPKPW